MSRIEGLIEKAKKMKERGLTTGEIADELNVSRETALWLLTKAREDIAPPSDIYIELKTLSSSPYRVRNVAKSLADMIIEKIDESPEVVIGIATSGIPVATMVAEELDSDLGIYYPRKLKWEKEKQQVVGAMSENFAKVEGRKCVAVDDIISTGSTIREVSEYVKRREGKLLCASVIIDKKGLEEVDGAPVLSLFRIVRI
ncbi:MAG: orotate phosphoribosyltransferase-like protein [Archaeoglobus sp.]|nr:orotate phosphoribosyltransferase-like protein [Archaeoglobus sp.]